MEDLSTLDLIYEAASVPEMWTGVLERLAALSRSRGTGLICFDSSGSSRFIATESYRDAMADFAANSHSFEQRRPRKTLAEGHTGFVHDLELFPQEQLDADPVYMNFMHPYGLKWGAGTVIPTPTSDILVFDVSRTIDEGPFDRETMELLDPYRPHLARAALISHRLGLKAARAATEALATIGVPGAVLTASGRVLSANHAFESLAPRVTFQAFDRVQLADARADTMFRRALEQVQLAMDDVRSIPLKATESANASVVHVVPLRRAALDIFTGAAALVVITPVTMPGAPLANVLTGLFDLTPAETIVARAIARGESVEQIALANNRSRETVRTQLKSILDKTGTTRQAELALLLSGLSALPKPAQNLAY